MLKNSMIQFFKQKMNIDVSNASIIDVQISGKELGFYSCETNSIAIDVDKIKRMYKGVSDIVIDASVVHELVHLCQLTHNKSLILPINNIFTGRLVNNRYVHLPAYQQPLEIDATIIECYYLYCSGEFNNDGIVYYAEHMLTNVRGEDILQYTQRLKDDGFCSVMCQVNQITKINSNKKEC